MVAFISYPTDYAHATGMLERPLRNGRLKIGHNTYLERRDDVRIDIVYHKTAIATLYPDGSVSLDNGGWHTRTTLQRLSDILKTMGLGRVTQTNGNWYVVRGFKAIPYTNGMRIKGVLK